MIKYLLSKASTGKFRVVYLECSEENNIFTITRRYGQLHGKITEAPEIIISKGKVKRTVEEQAMLQFNSELKKYSDKGYKELEKDPELYSEEELQEFFGDIKTNQYGVIKPMLAKQSEKVTNTKIFDKEWLASRKLDGVRCLLYYKDGEIHTASRGGEHYDYSTEFIRTDKRLIKFFEINSTVILDGELFKRFKSLQQISGAARLEKQSSDYGWLEYWIYDCYIPDMCAIDRQDFLMEQLGEVDIPSYTGVECDEQEASIRLLTQVHVLSGWEGMQKLHDQYVSEGFEGVVIRDPSKPYKPGGRTNDMIKIKKYKSSEFLVTGYELGLRGSEDMTFICETEDGIVFKAMPVGDREVKAEYVENFEEKYKGHMAECTYFNLSDDGIPTQPRMRVFRFDLE